jgi:hypothetical protein
MFDPRCPLSNKPFSHLLCVHVPLLVGVIHCEHAKALRVIALEEKEADYSGSGILEGMRVQGVLEW